MLGEGLLSFNDDTVKGRAVSEGVPANSNIVPTIPNTNTRLT